MTRISAGILPYRRRSGLIEVLLVHPGGPYFAQKDDGVWSIPKGEPHEGEDLLDAARREFTEETGFAAQEPFLALQPIVQRGGKRVHAWAADGAWDADALVSNTCTIEYPPRTGRLLEIPEVDRAAWYSLGGAARKMNPAQVVWLAELASLIDQRTVGRRR